MKQVPVSSRYSVDGSENLVDWRTFGGGGARLCLGFMQSGRFQECGDDSYDVQSTFHYIPYCHQYIQHNEIQSVKLNAVLSVVFGNIVYDPSEHTYLYLLTASYFCNS